MRISLSLVSGREKDREVDVQDQENDGAVWRIRIPHKGDARDIAHTHICAWRAAYPGIMSTEYLDSLDVDSAEKRLSKLMDKNQVPDSRSTIFICEINGVIVGITSVAYPSESGVSGEGELRMLNVHPEWWGKGVGEALLSHGGTFLLKRGAKRATLWVAEKNMRARKFYGKHGWSPNGVSRIDRRFDPAIPEVQLMIVWQNE